MLDKNKPKIQTVVNKIDAIHNDYRTMQLEVLAGNHSLVTMVVENGLRFHVDLAAVYVHFTCNIIEHSTEIFRCLFFSSLAENQLKRHFFLFPSQSGICIIQFSVFIILCFWGPCFEHPIVSVEHYFIVDTPKKQALAVYIDNQLGLLHNMEVVKLWPYNNCPEAGLQGLRG